MGLAVIVPIGCPAAGGTGAVVTGREMGVEVKASIAALGVSYPECGCKGFITKVLPTPSKLKLSPFFGDFEILQNEKKVVKPSRRCRRKADRASTREKFH